MLKKSRKNQKTRLKIILTKRIIKNITPTAKGVNRSPFVKSTTKEGSMLNRFVIVTPKSKLVNKDTKNSENQRRLSKTVSADLTEIKVPENKKLKVKNFKKRLLLSKTLNPNSMRDLLESHSKFHFSTNIPMCQKLLNETTQSQNIRPYDQIKKILNFDLECKQKPLIVPNLDLKSINKHLEVSFGQASLTPSKNTPTPCIKRHRSYSEEHVSLCYLNEHADGKSAIKKTKRLHLSFLNESENQWNTTWREIKKDNDLFDSLHYKYKLNAKRIGKMKSYLPQSHLPGNHTNDNYRRESLIEKLKAIHISNDFNTNSNDQIAVEEIHPKFLEIDILEDPIENIEVHQKLISDNPQDTK